MTVVIQRVYQIATTAIDHSCKKKTLKNVK